MKCLLYSARISVSTLVLTHCIISHTQIYHLQPAKQPLFRYCTLAIRQYGSPQQSNQQRKAEGIGLGWFDSIQFEQPHNLQHNTTTKQHNTNSEIYSTDCRSSRSQLLSLFRMNQLIGRSLHRSIQTRSLSQSLNRLYHTNYNILNNTQCQHKHIDSSINQIELPSNVGTCCSYHSFIASNILANNQSLLQSTQHSHNHYSTINIPTTATGDRVIAIETNNIRYGINALHELGVAARYLTPSHSTTKSLNVIVFTDKNIHELDFFQNAIRTLKSENCNVHIYSDVSVEPTDSSWKHAIEYSQSIQADLYISIGGGSVMDTCKIANLYTTYPTNNFLDYVNKPIGAGKVPGGALKPHIACPTTAGTGSESTGIAICDITELNVKTGVAHKLLRPTMAIVDPIVTHSMPSTVTVSSAFDVMCHALESYTAVPHYDKPAANTPRDRFLSRPLSQGANRWADSGCLEALRILGKQLVAAKNGSDKFAREELMYASMLAGIAFGNSGVHIPHAMSYSVAGNVQSYQAPAYNISDGPIIPHGMAVILNAPASFRFTSTINPVRHYEVAQALGCDMTQVNPNESREVGELLSNKIIELMRDTDMPNGLHGVGYTDNDLDTLVNGCAQQTRLLSNAPVKIEKKHLHSLYKNAMSYW